MALPPHTIRIKRPRDETPVPSLFIDSKRQKTVPVSAEPPAYFFRLAHTVPNKDSPVNLQINPQHLTVTSPTKQTLAEPFSPSSPLHVTALTPPPPAAVGKPVQDAQPSLAVPSSRPASRAGPRSRPTSPAPVDTTVGPNQPPVEPRRQGTFGKKNAAALTPRDDMPSPVAGEKRKIAPIRKYHLAKRLRPHPYAGGKRSAIFERMKEEAAEVIMENEEEALKQAEEQQTKRKKPRTNPKEKEVLREREKAISTKPTEKNDFGYAEDDPLTKQLQSMVLEYLNADTNDGIKNLPPPEEMKRPKDRIGGGVGGGSWANMEKEDEDGFVYDVYYREEVKDTTEKTEGEDYGLIVIEGSDDEAWWYEGEGDDDSDDPWASDDEDSNAEDYHTHDYPEEPVYDSEHEDEYGLYDQVDADDDDEAGMSKPWRRTNPDDEEYDLDDESDDEHDIDAKLERMKRGVWGYGGKRVAPVDSDEDSDDEDDDDDDVMHE